MKKNYFFVVFSLLLHFSSYSQSEKIPLDSLEKLTEITSEALDNYEYHNSIQYSLQLIELASRIENHYYLYHGYNYLGITYASMENASRALDNYENALENAIASKNDTLLWWAYNNLGNVYSQNENTWKKGLTYYDKAINVVNRIGDIENGIDPIINKGWTHLDYEQYDRAYPYLIRAEKILGPHGDEFIKTQLQALFGMYYSGKGDFEKSRCFFESSVYIAERDSLVLEAAFAYEEYAEMLFKSNAYQEAYLALEKHMVYEEELIEEEKIRQMEAAYTQFETEGYRRDLETAQREQQLKDEVIAKSKQVSNIMIGFSILMLIFLILLIRSNSIRKALIGELKCKNNELKTAKEEAERLSMLKTKFFSTVSHELRTPLHGVVGLTSLLLEDNSNKKQEEDLKSLKFSADYLLALINDVLQMNKIESNLVQLENMPFNINDLMSGIVKSFEFTRNQNQNVIELEIDEKIPSLLIGDSVRLSQILMNLMGNALKFTERGKVWIKAERKICKNNSCLIYFEIGDTGIGIPKSKQQEVFDEFSQLKSTNYNYQGTGLGLPIVKKLLQLFNVEISLKSEEGKGSVFGFEILFEEAKIPEKKHETIPNPHNSKENGTKKALIVDDNRINQVVTQRILEKRDFECNVASSGKIAIELLKNEAFDLVLMDVNMPEMNGMEATKEIRKFNPNVPIIALTAVEIEEMRKEILDSGMNDIIVKPYDIHEFFQTIFRNLLVEVE